MNDLVKVEYLNYLKTSKGARKYGKFKKILYGVSDSLVKNVSKILIPELKGKKFLSILDIGGGDGKRIIAISRALKARGSASKITIIEPSRALTKGLKTTNIKLISSLFEDFKSKEKYDLIILIHSIFTFKGTGYIKKIKGLLEEGGLLCVVSNDSKSFLAELKTVVDEGKGSRQEISSVLKDLDKNGFTYKMKRFDTNFDDCTKGINLTSRGKTVLEWIALTPYNTIPKDQLKRATACFVKHSNNGRIGKKEVVVLAKFR